jgi:DNA replication protein DnaC
VFLNLEKTGRQSRTIMNLKMTVIVILSIIEHYYVYRRLKIFTSNITFEVL